MSQRVKAFGHNIQITVFQVYTELGQTEVIHLCHHFGVMIDGKNGDVQQMRIDNGMKSAHDK